MSDPITGIIDLETPDGHRHLVVPAHVVHHSDIEPPSDLVRDRGDFGFVTGRFVQFDDGTNTAFNRNGNMFSPKEHIHEAAKLVRYTPLNMLHKKDHIIGTFIGTSVVDPHGALGDALADAQAKLPYPWIDSLSAVWKYHFRDEWSVINKAFGQGAAFLSMEAVAQTMTCFTPGCPCEGDTYPYEGIRSATYCDALNTPRAKKRLNYPWFVGGAMVVPPAMPAWRRADITHIAATLAEHPEQAELVYEQVAAMAGHLDAAEWEFIMAMVLTGAFGDADKRPVLNQADVDRLFSCVVPDIKIDAYGRRVDVVNKNRALRDSAAAAAVAESEAGVLIAAGLAVVAADSGRVLMLQRAVDPADPASGMWEFPGGHIDPGETPLAAAQREFAEEVGCPVPDGQVVGTWVSPDGIYQGFVWLTESEAMVQCNLNPDDRHVLNPDDPDGDNIEVVAWWDPAHLPDMPALRAECASTDWDAISTAGDPENSDGIPQGDVNYRMAADGDDNCGSCCYFDETSNTCELVAGSIDPEWVCDLYTPEPEDAEIEPLESGVERT